MKHAFVAAMLLAAATTLHAQTPPADAGKRSERMMDCSKAQDPKQCEERRSRMRDAHSKAAEACKDKQGPERRACMNQQMCAQTPDPAKCNERHAKRGERHDDRAEAWKKAREACKDKQGDELKKCMRDHRPPRPAPKN